MTLDVPPPPPPPDDRPVRHVVVDVAPRSVVFALLVIVTLVVTYWMLTSIPAVLIRSALGIFLALALNPVVDAAMRRLRLGRAAAVTVVIGGFLVAAGAFGVLAVPRAVNQLSHVGDQVSGVVHDLDDLPLAGKAIRDNGIDQRVADFLDNLPDTLATRDKALRGIVTRAGDGLVTAFWVLLVAITALLDGPRLGRRHPRRAPGAVPRRGQPLRRPRLPGDRPLRRRDGLPGRGQRRRRDDDRPVARDAAGAAGRRVVGAWNIVPQIGGFMGGATLVVLSPPKACTPACWRPPPSSSSSRWRTTSSSRSSSAGRSTSPRWPT